MFSLQPSSMCCAHRISAANPTPSLELTVLIAGRAVSTVSDSEAHLVSSACFSVFVLLKYLVPECIM